MSGKIEISRELAERLAFMALWPKQPSLDAQDELRSLLFNPSCGACNCSVDGCRLDRKSPPAAPVVGRQPVAWLVPEEGFLTEMPSRAMEWVDAGFRVTPLYTSPPAPVAVDAAKAFAKGFNTLETVGGKYKIVMQFAGHDDAWEAYSALGQMTACLDKVKELNK